MVDRQTSVAPTRAPAELLGELHGRVWMLSEVTAEWKALMDYRANGQRDVRDSGLPFPLPFGVILSNEAMTIRINMQ